MHFVKRNIFKIISIVSLLFLLISCGSSEPTSDYFKRTSENTIVHKFAPYNGVLFTAAFYAPNLSSKSSYASFILEGSSASSNITISEGDFKASILPLYFEEESSFDKRLATIASVDAKLRAPFEIVEEAPKVNFLKANFKTDVRIGDKWNDIYAIKNIEKNYRQTLINATCMHVSEHAYFFVEDGYSVADDILKEIGADFDEHYGTLIERFSTPNDIDGNGKPSFLIMDINSASIMGFFYQVDMLPRGTRVSGNVVSNGADMLYINIRFLTRSKWNEDRDRIIATFFHELQHMTFQSYRDNNNLPSLQDSWLNEGMSMLAEYYCGHAISHKDYVEAFLKNRMHDSMTNSSITDYGYYLLFLRFLQERYGNDIQKKIYASSHNISYKLVEDATGVAFPLLYADFVKSLLLSGRTVVDTNVANYSAYKIDNWTMPEGTSRYLENGFNLKDSLDTIISNKRYVKNNNYYITTSGFNANNVPYNSFFITRWERNVEDLSFSTNYANLFYAIVEP